MALNISSFLTPKIILLGAFSLVLLIAIITLFFVNRKLKKKVSIKEIEEEEEDFLKRQLNELKNSGKSPEILLNSIDLFARNFFLENFKLNVGLDYSEMVRIFKEKKKNRLAVFCQKMLEILYSGERVNRDRIRILLNELEDIINEEHPKLKDMILEEKEEIKPIVPQIIQTREKSQQALEKQSPRFSLPHLPEADKIANELSQVDEEKIRDAYKELQRIFRQAYTFAEISKNKEEIIKLEAFRETVIKTVNEYYGDPFKIVELAQEIANGAKLIKSLES